MQFEMPTVEEDRSYVEGNPKSKGPRGTGRLRGKTAIVTGAGSIAPGWGNGRATAVLFAREGANVVVADLDAAAAEETAEIIRAEGGSCRAETLDVTDLERTEAIVAACVAAYGGVDILHCNVGRGHYGGPTDMTVDDFRADLELCLVSAFIGCKAVLPVMVGQGRGVINTVGSISGYRHLGHDHIGYATSKAALVQFTRQVAVQYGPQGIRANTIVPGMIDTPLIEHREAKRGLRGGIDALREIARQRVPLGRRGTAWDVATAATFLASDDANYITATEILVDGGFISRTV